MALTETWLSVHSDKELFIDGYQLFRGDRIREKEKRGRYSGGVALYVRDDLANTCEVTCQYSNGVVEILSIYSKKENLLITVVYRQPDNNLHRSQAAQFHDALVEFMKCLPNNEGVVPDIILVGDFNLPRINWGSSGGTKAGVSGDERQMIEEL